jgi:hypothetical protein
LLSDVLFTSAAFRHLLAIITQLVPLSARPIEARRFRPGLDYTLARSDNETCLDVTLNLTPDVVKPSLEHERQAGPRGLAGKAKKSKTSAPSPVSLSPGLLTKKEAKELQAKWDSGDIGGWECYMAPHEGEEDPTIYQAGNAGKKKQADASQDAEMVDSANDAEDEEEDGEEEEEDGGIDSEGDNEGVLLNLMPSFNTLSVVLRDEGVLRFVKYLAASAGGSRWDVVGEFEVGFLEQDDEAEEQDAAKADDAAVPTLRSE